MKKNLTQLFLALGLCGSVLAQTSITGPSTAHTPYLVSSVPGSTMVSILTVTESIGSYTLCGLGDGLGAYDNGDGTFTLLMNHEMGTATGTIHAHGQTGAYVSKWVINKNNLSVVSGSDLIQNVNLWTGTTYTTYNSVNTSTLTRFGRFCAADLPAPTAFYNSLSGKGSQAKIFMNGEENGNEGRAFAHISTGSEAGTSYELPYMGKLSYENAVPSPFQSDKTIVASMDDSTPGQVYIYVGTKTNSGSEIVKAGLQGGKLYGVSVLGMMNEQSASIPAAGTTFTLIDMGSGVQNMTGATLNTNSNNMGVTNFLRPEDGAWDPNNPRDFYFVTTNSFSSPSRMWRLRFNDIEKPELGGSITAVLSGTEGQRMLDNMVMDNHGHALLQEDPGGQIHTAKIWQYKVSTDALTLIADHDTTRFKTGGVNYLTIDEESSGIIDMQGILGAGWFILFDQAHYSIPSPAIDGGQLLAFYNPATAAANPEINVQGNATSINDGLTTTSPSNNTAFGSVNLGTGIAKTFVIQNTNSGTLIVSALKVSGSNAGDFTISGPGLPFTLAGNSSQTITATFNPALLGVRNAIINVVSSDWDENNYDFAVQGEAVAPEINLTGNNQNIQSGNTTISASDNTDFGTVLVNTPVVKEFVIQNTGTGTLNITSIAITGTNTSVFSFVNAPAFPLNIANGASVTFSIQYLSPVPNVINTAMVNISNNDSDENSYSFKIEGKTASDVGINQFTQAGSLVSFFPNPANNEATIKLILTENETASVNVYDILGKKVLSTPSVQFEKGEREIKLNTSSLKNGEYFIAVKVQDKISTLKMVVSH